MVVAPIRDDLKAVPGLAFTHSLRDREDARQQATEISRSERNFGRLLRRKTT